MLCLEHLNVAGAIYRPDSGPIGVEMSQTFTRLSTQVMLIQGPDRLLPREDPEVSASIAEVLSGEGVKLVMGARLISLHYSST